MTQFAKLGEAMRALQKLTDQGYTLIEARELLKKDYPGVKFDYAQGWKGVNARSEDVQKLELRRALEGFNSGKFTQEQADKIIQDALMIKTDYGTKTFGEALKEVGKIGVATLAAGLSGGPWAAAAAFAGGALNESAQNKIDRAEELKNGKAMSLVSGVTTFLSSDIGKQVVNIGLGVIKGALNSGGNTGVQGPGINPGAAGGGGGNSANDAKPTDWTLIAVVAGFFVLVVVGVKFIFGKSK